MSREVLLVLRGVHLLAAAAFLGSTFFNYFLFRRARNFIPPPQAAVIAQKIGAYSTIVIWASLGLVAATGLLRLYYLRIFDSLLTWGFYTTRYGRWMAVKIALGVVIIAIAAIITWYLQPRLLEKLTPAANPGPGEVTKRRDRQMSLNQWLERLVLYALILGVIVFVAATSLQYGGLF